MSNLITLPITGEKIMESLHKLNSKRSIAEDNFQEVILAENCTKDAAAKAMTRLLDLERSIALLQTIQTQYNLFVVVDTADNKTIPLTEAVKRIGGETRGAQMWKASANRKLRKKFGVNLKFDDAIALSSNQQLVVRQLRTAIDKANGTVVDMEVPPELFE